MSYTEELLEKANEVIPRVTLEDFNNDQNSKLMIDVRQHEELVASGSIKGSIHIPKGYDDLEIRSKLLNDYNLEIGAGLGKFSGKIWRIGLMGYNARNESVDYCLDALTKVLNK